jgi:hypothetical protein
MYREFEIPPYLKCNRRKKRVRRSGGLSACTHQPGRSMTLRPHLTMGLPFRAKRLDLSQYYMSLSLEYKPTVTFWSKEFNLSKSALILRYQNF